MQMILYWALLEHLAADKFALTVARMSFTSDPDMYSMTLVEFQQLKFVNPFTTKQLPLPAAYNTMQLPLDWCPNAK